MSAQAAQERDAAAARVRFRDLSVPEGPRRDALREAFERVLDSGMLLMGPEVAAFEATVARACGARDAVGVASGASALYLALKACGVGPGDEVITTAFSWIASFNAIAACGARPVAVDIGADLLIDPERIEEAISPRAKAILPVHFTGRLCAMDRIGAIAEAQGLKVVEDAAQAFGAQRDGVAAGAFGDLGAFSLNPMKIFSGYGEAGVVTFRDPALRERLERLRYLGTVEKEICVEVELNHKIDALQAALLGATLPFLPEWIERRQAIARRYCRGLADVLTCPAPPEAGAQDAIFFDFSALADDRDALIAYLAANGVEAKARHPIALPDQPAYADLPPTEIPNARRAARQVVCLPIHEKLDDAEIDHVVDSVRGFYGA